MPQAELIHHAVKGAVRMRTLINDLLSLSKIASERVTFQPTNLTQSLADALKNLSVRIEETHVQITHDELPTVWAENMQMSQLFQNLINNAIKFCNKHIPEIHIGAKQEGNECRISVKDNSIGFQ